MTTRTTTTKEGGPIHRLTDIVTEEVSMVDRAANKRKFLVVKRSPEMPAELKSDGKGGFTSAGVDKGGAPPFPPGKDKKKPPVAKGVELPPGAKEMMTPILTRASEKIGEVLDMVSSSSAAEVPEDGTMPGVPEELWAGLMEAAKLMAQLEALYPKTAAPPKDEEEAPETAPAGDPAPTEMQLAWSETTKALIAKVGAKMSKERLSRFEQALSVLGSILGELQAADPAAAPPAPQAPAGPGLAQPTKAAPKAAPAAPARKAEDLELAELAKSVNGLTAVVQRQNTELAAIKKARGPGNAIAAEGNPSREGGEHVSWPLDMNRPVSRDNVNKTESFFDS